MWAPVGLTWAPVGLTWAPVGLTWAPVGLTWGAGRSDVGPCRSDVGAGRSDVVLRAVGDVSDEAAHLDMGSSDVQLEACSTQHPTSAAMTATLIGWLVLVRASIAPGLLSFIRFS